MPAVRPGSAPFAGRESELAAVLAAFEGTRAGGPSVVLVTGEPGAGKSRLVAEAARQLGARHAAHALAGYALPDEALTAYFPLARALRPELKRQASPPPELRPALAVLAHSGLAPAQRRAGPGAFERPQTLESLVEVCAWLGAEQPLLLVLDDMQWAPAPTWEAITYLARGITDTGLMLLLAAREEVLRDAASAAAQALAELNRQRVLSRVALGALSPEQVGELAASLLGGTLSPALLRLLVERGEGNPFFTEELLGDLAERDALTRAESGWEPRGEQARMPLTVRLALAGRLNSLPGPTRSALLAGAVLSRAFEVEAVRDMLDTSAESVGRDLAPAQVAGLVDPGPDGGWAFRHDLIRSAVLDLSPEDHARLHVAAATALARQAGMLPGRQALAAIAQHWRLAGDADRAARAASAAAETAMTEHAHADALALARLARQMRERSPGPELIEARRRHGEAALRAGAYAEAEEGFSAALAEADVQLRAHLLARLGAVHRRRESAEAAAGCLELALELAHDADARLEAEVLVELAGLNALTRGRYEEADAQATRALRLAETASDPAVSARAALALANSRARAGSPTEMRPLLEHALERALAADDFNFATEVCAALANSFYWTGEIGASLRYAQRRLVLAERGADIFAMRHAHSWLALLSCSRGDWAEARAFLTLAEPALSTLASPRARRVRPGGRGADRLPHGRASSGVRPPGHSPLAAGGHACRDHRLVRGPGGGRPDRGGRGGPGRAPPRGAGGSPARPRGFCAAGQVGAHGIGSGLRRAG